MTDLPEAPATGSLRHLSVAKLVGGAVLSILLGVASTSFYAGQRYAGLSDQLDRLATKIDGNQEKVTSSLQSAQAAGGAARQVLDGRVGKLETRQDRDDQTNRETASAVARLDGKMDGVQHSMDSVQHSVDYIIGQLARGGVTKESRADR